MHCDAYRMARQTDDNHRTLKNAADQCSSVSGSYVKNVAVKFEEKVGETTSSRGLVQVQKSRNVRISFRLNDRLSDKPSRTVARNTDSNKLKCPGNMPDLDRGRKDTLGVRPAVQQVLFAGDKSSNPLATSSTILSDAISVDAQSATDIQPAEHTKSSNARCGRAPPVNRCITTLNPAMSMSSHLSVDSCSANISDTSIRCG